MKKIYLIIAGAVFFLFLIILTLFLLSRKPSTNTQSNSLFPTSIPDQGKTGQQTGQLNNQNLGPTSSINMGSNGLVNSDLETGNGNNQNLFNLVDADNLSTDISQIPSVETMDFRMRYSSQQQKLIVEKKTPLAEEKFTQWLVNNKFSPLINRSDKVVILSPDQQSPDTQNLLDFLNIFLNIGQGTNKIDINVVEPSIAPTISQPPTKISKPTTSTKSTNLKMTYYAQCGDQGSTPLPSGGTLCSAGCGPTSVAMIASSYIDKKYDPKTVVNIYKNKGYLLGGDGSRYSDAHELLKGLGLKTTDYIVFNYEKSDSVVPQLRKYLNAGWTFFTLASFCDGGCGHYFWITDIDSNGNIWAYDPAYGRYKIPYNENTRYPFPQYRLAFGVKK